MKAINHPDFKADFPEQFNWCLLDSHKLSAVAVELAGQIKNELNQPIGNRVNVVGLRFALLRIAGKGNAKKAPLGTCDPTGPRRDNQLNSQRKR